MEDRFTDGVKNAWKFAASEAAKLGSDYKKPDATTLITPENYQEILWPLPVGDLLFVGPQTVPKLRRRGINTIGDIAALPRETLAAWFAKSVSCITSTRAERIKAR